MKNQKIKTGKLQMKAMLLAGVLVFESVFAGIGPVNAQTVSENEITSMQEKVIDDENVSAEISVSGNTPEQDVIPETKMSGPQEENVPAEKAAIKYSGTDGKVNWSIDTNGHLTLTGNGDYKGSPNWLEYKSEIKSAVVTVTNMTNTAYMFDGCSNLRSLNLSSFNTSKVIDMYQMFQDCSSITSLDLSNFVTSNVIDMSYMFEGCSNLVSLNVSSFDTSSVVDMSYMFGGCSNLVSLNVSSFNTSNVGNMSHMFSYCSSLISLDLSNFDTSNVTDMSYMFCECINLKSLDLSSFDTSKVEGMSHIFSYCSSLTSLDVSNFNTSNVRDMSYIFYDCSMLTSLDLSKWDLGALTRAESMLDLASNLVMIILPNIPSKIYLPNSYYDEKSILTSAAQANIGPATYTLKAYADSYCGKNAHTYCIPIFTWAPDYSSAQIYLECTREDCIFDVSDKCVKMDAVVTKETIEATGEKDGVTIYTATAVYKSKTYTDVKKITIPKLPAQSTQKPAIKDTQPIGTTLSVSTTFYRVTKAGATPELAYMGPKNKKVKKITVPATVTIDGVTYKVTSVADGALKNYKNLTKVTVGKNITKIGKNAFYGCKKLKTIVIKTQKLKGVGKNALKGIKKNATIDVPNSKKKAYKKLLKAKTGYKKTMVIK